MATLREAGKPLCIADLQPSPVDDSQNAAIAIGSLEKVISDYDHQLAKATLEIETDEEHVAAAIQVARKSEIENPGLVVKLREASRLPKYQPDYDFSLGPTPLVEDVLKQVHPIRTVVRVLRGHGLMSLSDGKTDEAVLDAIAILRWSEHLAKEPLMVNYLVSVALFGEAADLAASCIYAEDASLEMRSELVRMFEDTPLADHFAKTLDTELAFGISSFDSFPLSRFQFMLGELSDYIDVFSEMKSIAKMPTGLAPSTSPKEGLFTALAWPSFASSLASLRRSQAKARALQILATWQTLGSDTAISIDDLGLPESVCTDPFDGSSMKLTVVGDSIAIYAVGQDMVDNDGSVDDERDIGISP
ncbi:hypothetical protein CA13_44080 [Planctomycetes bacterium CA13]|uniref:Uncharacterized protein n=1 Tax=Novipirellula herctigrandis TaxID=2527986 RepID=A0A5C5Z6U2_9BACT|nr:hypothetical protein CA13_44080 [Planctomycetes bacterium CA13]